MDSTLATVFFIAFIGGLVAGMICTVTVVSTSETVTKIAAAEVLTIFQGMDINCSPVPNLGTLKITVGSDSYFCKAKAREQEKGKDLILAPGGD